MDVSRVLSSLLVLMLVGARAEQPPPPRTLRVLTYNIHHGEGTDGVVNLSRIAGIVTSVRPDLVAVQEVDQATERTYGVKQLDELARLTGMHAQFGEAMDYMRGKYGVGVLSRWPLLAAHNEPLASTAEREPRTALTVQVKLNGDGPLLQFTCTHLDQGREEQIRLAQAADLSALGRDARVPALLAGDLNARPDTDAMKVVDAEWTNALTVDQPPAATDGRPRFRGDYVLFKPASRWRVIESTVMEDRVASDHRPVLVVLEWLGTP